MRLRACQPRCRAMLAASSILLAASSILLIVPALQIRPTAGGSIRGAGTLHMQGKAQQGLSAHSAAPPQGGEVSMLTITMTSCTPAAEWQSLGLYYSFLRWASASHTHLTSA